MPVRVAAKAPPVKVAWQTAFLKSIKAPVTHANVAFLTSWWKQEGGDLTNNARFNWLNTTHGSQYPAINSVGVRSYPNFQTGVNTLRDVMTSGYPGLTRAFRNGNASVNDPAVQADLNRWLTGNRVPGMSKYIQRIASSLGGPVPAERSGTPGSPFPGSQEGSQGALQAPVASAPYAAPDLGTVSAPLGAGKPLANMPGISRIDQISIQAVLGDLTPHLQRVPASTAVSSVDGYKYVDPIPSGSVRNRTDQGVDFQAPPGSLIAAIGDAKVVSITNDPGGYGRMVVYRLLSGPLKGAQIFVGHTIPLVKIGQTIRAGQAVTIAHRAPGSSAGDGWVEIGYASGSGTTRARARGELGHGHGDTLSGQQFLALLHKLGVK